MQTKDCVRTTLDTVAVALAATMAVADATRQAHIARSAALSEAELARRSEEEDYKPWPANKSDRSWQSYVKI